MPKIVYVPKNFSAAKLVMIEQANAIMVEYARQGFDITLRQLYYQFVSRDLIPNKQEEYSKLGDLISDARLAGLIDWHHIVDRTRNLRGNTHWEKPSDILQSCAYQFCLDKWQDQTYYVEVWVEKDALVGIVGQAAAALDVPYFSCRGYTSQSEMWSASQRILKQHKLGKKCVIIHLGDHDPSGIDMSRDILGRLKLFTDDKISVLRVALNMVQVKKYNPPPNPAKVTDSRYEAYKKLHGEYSWELDALDPQVLTDIIRRAVARYCDQALFDARKAKEARARTLLITMHKRWNDIVRFLQEKRDAD